MEKMKKLTIDEIRDEINFEDKCGVNDLLQEIFSHKYNKIGIDVLMDKKGFYKIIKGNTLKVKTHKSRRSK